MSTSVLQEFLVKIGFDVNKAQLGAVDSAIVKTGASAKLLDTEVTAAAASVNTGLVPALKSMILPLTGITAAIGYAYKKTFDFIQTSAEGFEQIAHLANRVNTSADAIKKLGYIAQFTGSSVEAAQSSLDGLNRAAGSAALGVGRAKVIFKDIGVNVKDSNGHLKDTTQLLYEVGNKVKGMERGKQLAVLSRLGIDPTLINALTTDVTKLSNEYDRVMKSAGIDNNKAAESAVRFAEASKRVGNIWKAVKDAVAASFFDQFAKGFDTFSDTLINNLPQIIGLLKPLIISMIKIAEIALKLGAIFGGVATKIVGAVSKINQATDGWAIKIGAVVFAIKKLNFALLRSPVGIVFTLITAFSLLKDEYDKWKKSGESFIPWLNKSHDATKILGESIVFLTGTFYAVKIAMLLATGLLKDITRAFEIARAQVLLFNLALQVDPLVLGLTAIAGAIGSVIYFATQLHKIFVSVNGDIDKLVEKSSKLFQMPGLNLANSLTHNPIGAFLDPAGQALKNQSAKTVTVNNNTAINVQGSGSPYETAVAVKNQQKAVNANQARNFKGAVR